jgi:hypothetical protein
MKIPRLFIVLTFLIALLPNTTLSQTSESNPNPNDTLVSRKLYLHCDRDQYFLGDTIWYKAYYLDGQSNIFVPGLISMYVDVINEMGQSVLDQAVPIDNGAADGAIDLPDSLKPGNYILRAFTDFQKQIGEEAFFYKQLKISRLESFVEGADQPEQAKAQEIDVAFLPEGGMLLEGHMNAIGIKAIDSHGKGIQVQGEIIDSRGEAVTAFTSSYKGMASAGFFPEKDETYKVRVTGYPDYQGPLTDIVEEGIKLEFDKKSASNLHFKVVTNTDFYLGHTFYFAISHHGEVLFHKKFIQKERAFPIIVNKDALPAGINRLVLLDEQLLPISERLFFSTNYQLNEIKIKADKQAYETRSPVRLRLADAREQDNQSWSNLSMVVVDEFATSKEDPSSNILSWLLIDSELKGHIESPQDFFIDGPEMASARKLDLLMMTQGWSSYIWNTPEEYMALKSAEEEGFNIGGTVHRVIGKKPASAGTVDLKIYNNDFMHMDEVRIDEHGRFLFKGVSYLDTASVFLQARNKNDKLTYKITLDPFFRDKPPMSPKYWPKEELYSPKTAELYQKQYENLQALKDYTLKTGAFYIEEVTITEHKREPDDGHFRIHPKPTNSRKLSDLDVGALSVFDYIKTHFAGVRVDANNNVYIGGPSSFTPRPALLLLNGFRIDGDLLAHIPISEIDVVEVLKFAHETAIYGVRAGNGVVAVYTEKGGEFYNTDRYLPGTLAKRISGYASNREFYSPKYTPETINSEMPDHRIVLYWNPNIFTEKGRASVNFFTSDDLSRYNVLVEGITRDGRICLGKAGFEVDKRKDSK